MNITLNNKTFPISELYQPIYKLELPGLKRFSMDRLNSILQAEEGYNFNTMFNDYITDWGCSLGYFSFMLSEKTEETIYAIDYDKNNIDLCNEIKAMHGIKNVEFIHGSLLDKVTNTPSHIILSVLHHIQNTVFIPQEIIDKIKDANVIYLELAHCNEYPEWSRNLIPQEYFISPFHYLKKILEKQLPDFIIRLIGVHPTHLGGVRPLFQCKKKIHAPMVGEKFTGTIIDIFKLPYIDFGDFSLNKEGTLNHGKRNKGDISYAFGLKENNLYFLKVKEGEVIKVSPYIEGFLLSDIIKFGLLPYYDRKQIKQQLVSFYSKHNDPLPWNFFITDDSQVISIDSEESGSFCKDCNNISLSMLIQTI